MSETELRDVLGDFVAALRHSGLSIGIARVDMLYGAMQLLPVSGLRAVFLAGRATLCATPEEIARYDACFAQFFFGDQASRVEILPDPKAPPMLPGGLDMRRNGNPEEDQQEMETGAASPTEVLRARKLSALSKDEKTLIYALIARLHGSVAYIRGRRQQKAERGPIDVRRSVKAAFWRGGELDRLYHRRARPRIRKRVLLIDVSGSMTPFAPGLLRFGYAAYRGAPGRTEVFTVGTRLTRITRHLATSDAEAAIAAASRAVPDWSGGTRLGDQLKAFLDSWGQRGMARGATVVIASDGLERGGAELLQSQMQRLSGLAYRIIWANPHKSTPGFEPLTAGMKAALPAVDEFVAGSSANEIAALIRLMGASRR